MTLELAPEPTVSLAASDPRTADGSARVDETALVDGLRRGDRASAEQFARWLYRRMFVTALRILGDEQSASDAVQDAFVRVLTSVNQYRAEARFSTWVLRVVVNSALMIRRDRARERACRIDDMLPQFAADGHRLNIRGAWPALESADLQSIVRDCIDDLPEDARTILILRDVIGISNGECARILDIRPGAAKTRLHRARMALRELTERRIHGRIDGPRTTTRRNRAG